MKKGIVIVVIVVLLILITSFFNNRVSEKNIVKIGVIAGTTGEYASAGEGYMKGFNLALEEWNSSQDLKFEVVVEDDSFDAVKGLSAYQKIKSTDNPDAYAVLSSFTIDAIYEIVQEENKPVALGFEQSKQAEDDNIFQVLPAARPVQLSLGQELKKLGYKYPAVVVSNNTPVYQNFYSGFVEGFGESIKKYDFGSDMTGIRSDALSISKEQHDVVVLFSVPRDGALLIKELLKIYGEEKPFLAFDQSIQSGITDYKNILGSDLSKINGSIVSMSKNDLNEEFKNNFENKYGEQPPFGADMGYNSFMILAKTFDSSSEKWINNIKKSKISGADGDLEFDDVGLRIPNVFFGKLVDGEVVID